MIRLIWISLPLPAGIGAVKGLGENIRLQDRVARKLKALRHRHGALDLEAIEARPVFDGDEIKDLKADPLRFPDLSLSVSKLLDSGAMAGRAQPYGNDEMAALAKHCTEEQDAAKKVERQVTKSAAAMLLESRINEQFDAIVTGAADKGTWGPSCRSAH